MANQEPTQVKIVWEQEEVIAKEGDNLLGFVERITDNSMLEELRDLCEQVLSERGITNGKDNINFR